MYLYNNSETINHRRGLRRNQTEVEKRLWKLLRNKQFEGLKFFRQYSVGSYILDFYCPIMKLAIELDGGQHAETTNMVYDEKRSEFLKNRRIKVLRFWNNDVIENIEGVTDKLRMETTPPSLPLA
ncbi:MAG: DNA-cytosine methyltransferase [Candidatus Doudnabacteria bacterium RIFCSPHIGHO2_01_FULL_46_14]|uniref:DNA-cytosine methyltransferase n=1 Tax=Candidatus Doudnabacteria bacterium RIFCSPHIGHO2_01_FULL_46_14 TaxID=1817824 RepID=A0A1F5NJM1_9BACT|nr:MAG: DNA-cytosine methyltransferase [Candidatus Doudnabacteria bacterium RIFCSPHIGHO2_01_FULL_46_14]